MAAKREAEEAFARDPIGWHTGDVTVPITEPHRDYNTSGRMQRRTNMLEAILHEINQEPQNLWVITSSKDLSKNKRKTLRFQDGG
jgi:hypothetical protein